MRLRFIAFHLLKLAGPSYQLGMKYYLFTFDLVSYHNTTLGSPLVRTWNVCGPFVPAVSFDLDSSLSTRPSHVAGIPSSSCTLLEVSVVRFCYEFLLIFSYFLCNFFAVGDFLLSCPDERLPYHSAVAATFISLSTEHRFSVATR